MHEKQTSAIKKITLSTATYSDCVIEPTYINFFFGNNGSGKTTISRAINAYRKPANQLPNSEAEDGSIEFETGKFSNDYNILVYNQDFIEANIQKYGSLPGVFTMNEHNITTQNEIAAEKEKKDKLDIEIAALSEKKKAQEASLVTIFSNLQASCWEKTKDIRERFPEAQEGCRRDKKKFCYKILDVTSLSEHDTSALQNLYDTAFDPNARTYPLLNTITDTSLLDTIEGLELLQSAITSSSDTDFARFIKAINATDWVRKGHEQYHDITDGKCPYCQQTLPGDFETKVTACFDEQYQADVNKLNELLSTYKDTANNLFIPLQNNANSEYAKLDFSEYNDKLVILKAAIAANIQAINLKLTEPGAIKTIEAISPILTEISDIITEMNKQITDNNLVVNSKKKNQASCIKEVWELMAYTTRDEVTTYNKEKVTTNNTISEITENITNKTNESKAILAEIDKKSSTIVNTSDTVKSMNTLLSDSGFQGFKIEEDFNAQNIYRVVRLDGTPAEKLSEGERNFIAFLYFYHQVHGNGNVGDAEGFYGLDNNFKLLTDGSDNRDKIVVIDDPVSSMDSSSLFIVGSLVREMVSICKNNVSLSGQEGKEKYIKQIFVLTHNAYFHREITVNQERHYRYASFYLITKNDNVSSIRLCTRKNRKIPTELENYNPVQNSYAALWTEYKEVTTSIPLLNTIRRILEYYFIQLCGYDGTTLQERILKENRDKFVTIKSDGTEDTSQLQVVSSMLSYISSNSFGANDGLHFIDDCIDVEQYRELFEEIFTYMEQQQHYKMMMGSDE